MDSSKLQEDFGNAMHRFEKDITKISQKTTILYAVLIGSISLFGGYLIGSTIAGGVYINSFVITVYSLIITLEIGFATWLFAWKSDKWEKFLIEYTDLRSNYLMSYIQIVDKKLSTLEKTLNEINAKI